ncbi:MAG TPA: hypothetical protein VGB62_03105 [Allosphingosinicella sp.]|jgi:hypothetical protein
MRIPVLLLALGLASCGQGVQDEEFANRAEPVQPEASRLVPGAVPVRIGDLGPNFAACSGAGTTRHVAADAMLPVRSAPSEAASEIGAVAPGARFFVCTRSLNQKWMGIVYREDGGLNAACGVSAPVTSRRGYEGPCRSGWVSSAFVKLIAGGEDPAGAPAANQGGAQPVPSAAAGA